VDVRFGSALVRSVVTMRADSSGRIARDHKDFSAKKQRAMRVARAARVLKCTEKFFMNTVCC
jgi:hypothetical protein